MDLAFLLDVAVDINGEVIQWELYELQKLGRKKKPNNFRLVVFALTHNGIDKPIDCIVNASLNKLSSEEVLFGERSLSTAILVNALDCAFAVVRFRGNMNATRQECFRRLTSYEQIRQQLIRYFTESHSHVKDVGN